MAQQGDGTDVLSMAMRERAEFADLLDSLPPEQWEAPSLCEGWRVRDVAAHVISYEELGWPRTVLRLLRAGFNPEKANAIGVAEYSRSPAELVRLMRTYERPRGLTAIRGGMIALVDGMIHQQDIRRPLGLPRDIPHDRLRTALRLALQAPPIGAAKRARGLTLVADDLHWTTGSGPEVRGPGEALLMSIAGRPDALPDIDGPGRHQLAERM
ncbi:maleylpyruvate isomerase family mycothiol-dependent enzyme [Streptomonospora sp. PA3]|uniref:maleylpyruvate isomerase family mycothiol-dependent enzyme n=1 Tax=Streptomonospora sp. PA3 TaxID=2607326 RepID=UPI0012DDB34B|nr:maleylpyruvate isomerase family mycothiol-dependent enzyme [Streptomonospora sp. PA3]MUL43278.1 maleylpyruvate isomerase family mycothiol-dependent enzyme [Streptomonospora sp. PA3]